MARQPLYSVAFVPSPTKEEARKHLPDKMHRIVPVRVFESNPPDVISRTNRVGYYRTRYRVVHIHDRL